MWPLVCCGTGPFYGVVKVDVSEEIRPHLGMLLQFLVAGTIMQKCRQISCYAWTRCNIKQLEGRFVQFQLQRSRKYFCCKKSTSMVPSKGAGTALRYDLQKAKLNPWAAAELRKPSF